MKPSLNIWQWLGHWSGNNKSIKDWSIVLNYGNNFYEISPRSSQFREKIRFIEELNEAALYRNINDGKCRYVSTDKFVIPIRVNNNTIFFFCVYGEVKNFEANAWQMAIESMMLYESNFLGIYPTFLPFLIPFNDSDLSLINKFIAEKKDIFFLNGLNGTGKHTFVKNHLTYCYDESVEINDLKNQEPGTILRLDLQDKLKCILVNELALLPESDQKKLYDEILIDKSTLFFICSAYDIQILVKKGVVISDLEPLCVKNRIKFPSLPRRYNYLIELLQYYFLCKGRRLPFFITEDWIKDHLTIGGFDEIFKVFESFFRLQPAIGDFFERGDGIRDAVNVLEADSIVFAQKVVGNSQNKIAKLLGISRGSLQHKLKKYKISYQDWEE